MREGEQHIPSGKGSWEYVDVRTTYPMGRVPAILQLGGTISAGEAC
jgi:hypothetical protein